MRWPVLAVALSVAMGAGGAARAQPGPAADPELVRVKEAIELGQRELRAASEDGDRDGFARCADAYLAAHALAADASFADELLFDAAYCAAAARSVSLALHVYQELITRYPSSRLAAPAQLAVGRLLERIADHRGAAEAFERLALRYPGDDAAADALRTAIVYRAALGELDAAARDAERAIRLWGATAPEPTWQMQLGIAGALLDRGAPGDRARARDWLTRAVSARPRTLGPWERLAVARLLWDGSCPDAPRDRLCLDGPGRDRDLAAAGQALARMLIDEPERWVARRAQLLVADSTFEQVATLPAPRTKGRRSGPTELDRLGADAAAGYRRVVDEPLDDEAAVMAHARLGQLADLLAARATAVRPARGRARAVATLGPDHGAAALAAYGRCLEAATAATAGEAWLALCERGAVAHGAAVLGLRERVPAAVPPTLPTEPEPVPRPSLRATGPT